MGSGILLTACAFTVWGLFPLYLKAASAVGAGEMLAHRVVWSMLFVGVILLVRRQWGWLSQALRTPALLAQFALSAALLGANWMTYVWAVHADRVVDASLGYFINPLLSVLIGFLVLKERLRGLQWTAVALAALGVAWLTWHAGKLPWIAIVLAVTFALYGLLRKTARLGPLEGLALESALVAPFGVAYLYWGWLHGTTAFTAAPTAMQLLLMGVGPLTAIPLLMFAAGARRIPLSAVGLLQYIAPSLQLATGVLLYHEAFGVEKKLGFVLIWIALALYSADSGWRAWAGRKGRGA